METIDSAKEDNEVVAAVSLLNMGIKTVPEAILRTKFADTCSILLELMKRFVDTENQNVLRSVSFFLPNNDYFKTNTHLHRVDNKLHGSRFTCPRICSVETVINP